MYLPSSMRSVQQEKYMAPKATSIPEPPKEEEE